MPSFQNVSQKTRMYVFVVQHRSVLWENGDVSAFISPLDLKCREAD